MAQPYATRRLLLHAEGVLLLKCSKMISATDRPTDRPPANPYGVEQVGLQFLEAQKWPFLEPNRDVVAL